MKYFQNKFLSFALFPKFIRKITANAFSGQHYPIVVFANSCPGTVSVPRVSVKASFVPSPNMHHRLSGASQSVPAFSPSLRYKKHKYEANV